MIICVDIWGGPNGFSNHVNTDEALQLARRELADGYLVNLHANPRWGAENNFDSRIKPPS
jgi:hypothetical protein